MPVRRQHKSVEQSKPGASPVLILMTKAIITVVPDSG